MKRYVVLIFLILSLICSFRADAQDWEGIRGLDWSPDGQYLAVANMDGHIYIYDQTGALVRTLAGHSDGTITVAWSPDGELLASGGYDLFVKIWNVETGELEHRLAGHRDIVGWVAWRPDGSQLLSLSAMDSDNIRIWDTTSWENIETIK